MPVDLLLEVWFHVINQLPLPSIGALTISQTLLACALTCHGWLHRARVRLYRRPVLRRRDQFILFSRTLTDSPALGALVRGLYCCPPYPAAGAEFEDVGRHYRPPPFPPLAPDAVGQLTNLRLLFVETGSSLYSELVPFIRTFATCQSLRSLNLSYVQFYSRQDFLSVVWSFPRITALRIGCVWVMESSRELDEKEYPGRCRSLVEIEVLLLYFRPLEWILTSGGFSA